MAEHVFTILCQDAVIEDGSQRLSIFRIIERVNVVNVQKMEEESPTFIPHPMKLVSQWVRSDPSKAEALTIRYSITAPDGSREEGGTLEADLSDANAVRTIGNVKGFPNRGFGVYRFEIRQSSDGKKWKRSASFPMQFGSLEEWQEERGKAGAAGATPAGLRDYSAGGAAR